MLTVRDLAVSLSGRPILHGLKLSVGAGEIVGLVGPNGAGKSTLMRAAAGQLAFSGDIAVDGRPLAAFSPIERARRLAFLPQARSIAWGMTVADCVGLGRLPWRGPFARATGTDRAAVEEAMALFDVRSLAGRRADEISGGELARALAARAVAQGTPLLIADEPVAGLDPAHQIAMMTAFRSLAGKGRAIFVSMHDLTLAARWCDRIVLLSAGRIAAQGAPRDVLSPAGLRDVFGVDAHVGEIDGGLTITPLKLAEGRA